MTFIYDKASISHHQRSKEDQTFLQRWLFELQAFTCFSLYQNIQLVNLMETYKLQYNEKIAFSQGVQFCYACKGNLSIEIKGVKQKLLKKKNKKQKIEENCWVSGKKLSAKYIEIEGMEEDNQIIILRSEKSKKIIDKKYQCHWANLAAIIQRQSLFKYLDKDTLLDIVSDAKIKTLPYNNIIYHKGDQALFGYVLLQGNIMIINDGVQVSLLNPQQVFGDQEILEGKAVRSFKALIISENAKILKIQKEKIATALTVLTVLGRDKQVQKYLQSKRIYRQQITDSVKKYRKEGIKASLQKRLSKETLPLFKLSKKPSIQIQTNNDDPQQDDRQYQSNILPLRLFSNRKSSLGNIIRSKQTLLTPKLIQYQSTQIVKRRLSMLPTITK